MSDVSVDVDDLRTADGHDYFLVRPYMRPTGPAVMFLHWFDEAPNANRSQFLDEAKLLAEKGVVSVLPQLTFPWFGPPTDYDNDFGRIVSEVSWLQTVHSTLLDVDGVDASQIAVVGHDFGAMYGMLLLKEIEARCAVLIAPTPRWADWFLRFWRISSDRFDYMRTLDQVDPVRAISSADCPVLFQFGQRDFYIATMSALELFQAAREPKRMLNYESGHEMDLEEIRNDRSGYIFNVLNLNS
ncbi:MAG: alpha/beta fold hydrolase [Acidimicrobiia bacterium]